MSNTMPWGMIIREHDAGYTLASGSSSTASGAVAHRLGFCGSSVVVHMPGGDLKVRFRPDFAATLEGPVIRVGRGVIDQEMFSVLADKHFQQVPPYLRQRINPFTHSVR